MINTDKISKPISKKEFYKQVEAEKRKKVMKRIINDLNKNK